MAFFGIGIFQSEFDGSLSPFIIVLVLCRMKQLVFVKIAVQLLSHNLLIDSSDCNSCGILYPTDTSRNRSFTSNRLPFLDAVMCRPSGILILRSAGAQLTNFIWLLT